MKYLSTLLIFGIICLSSCHEEDEFFQVTESPEDQLEKISNQLQINEDRIKILDGAFILDEDIMIPFDNNIELKNGREKAYIITGVLNGLQLRPIASHNYNIDYYISPTYPARVTPIIQQALAEWSSINKCAITFNEISNLAHTTAAIENFDGIIFGVDNGDVVPLPSYFDQFQNNHSIFGVGSYPQNGEPGKYIVLNDNLFIELLPTTVNHISDDDELERLFIHEIGHNLGFFHADNPVETIFADGSPATSLHLSCTNLSNTNCNSSIMMSGPQCYSNYPQKPTTDDKGAVSRMYPTNYQTISINSHNISPQSGSSRIVKLNLAYNTNKPYKIIVHRFNPWNFFTPVQSDEFFCSSQSFSVEAPLGTWGFKIEHKNFMEDKKTLSNHYTVYVQ